MLRHLYSASLLSIVAFSTPAFADNAQDALRRFAGGVKTFEAHFEQVQTDEHGQINTRSSGHFWLSRPGRFRWVYEQPYQQITVCDGDKLWAYDPDLEQVTVRKAQLALPGTPAALLSQKTALSDEFKVQDAGSESSGRRVRLIPKSADSDFKSIELVLDKDGAPQQMKFADQIGGHSDITFSDVHTNAAIADDEFQFSPPKGVEVVDGDSDAKPGN